MEVHLVDFKTAACIISSSSPSIYKGSHMETFACLQLYIMFNSSLLAFPMLIVICENIAVSDRSVNLDTKFSANISATLIACDMPRASKVLLGARARLNDVCCSHITISRASYSFSV